jgi:2-polyprenyl-6-methoxyphenol hydroxylase-like FAD-dependent oxidoreductase
MAMRTVLISGAGISGPTFAYWLNKSGFKPTLLEHAPAPRSGGYVIDFWGLGYDIAERMGLRGELDRLGYHMRELRIVNAEGRRTAGFGVGVLRELAGGRFVTVRRSDLARLLIEKASPVSRMMFGDEIQGIDLHQDGVDVAFKHAPSRRFDLVIGADGLHSKVRALVFGSQARFERTLGYTVAAFESAGFRPRDENAYVMHSRPGHMLGRVALRDDRTLFLFVFAERPDDGTPGQDIVAQKALLRRRYGGNGSESLHVLDALDPAEGLYFDRVSQIEMPAWSRGRVALVGDAAFCPSLMAGQGSALAMAAAYVLAGELGRPDASSEQAFFRYEALFRPFIETKQRAAKTFSSAFVPRTRFGLLFRDAVISAAAIPGLARLTFGRDVSDRLALPEYQWS